MAGRVLIVCESTHHGNTKRVADAMASVLKAEVRTAAEVTPEMIDQYDLVGWGSGIYFARHSEKLREMAGKLAVRPRKAFVFSTAGLPFLSWWFHAALRGILRNRGCELVGDFCCGGWDTVGPLKWLGGIERSHPNAKDLERAEAFARSIKKNVLEISVRT